MSSLSVLHSFFLVPVMHCWHRGVLKNQWGYAYPRLRNIHCLRLEPHHLIIREMYTDRCPKIHILYHFDISSILS